MHLLVTRPAEDAAPLEAALAAAGHRVTLAPLMRIVPRAAALPPLDGLQGLIVTSANGARALARATARRDLALFAVGPATARAAREAGFSSVETADGDAAALTALIAARCDPRAGALLHAAGSVTAGDLKSALEAKGFTVTRAALYEAVAETPGEAALAALRARAIDGVLLFSPRTARLFAARLEDARLTQSVSAAAAFCLSAAVAQAALAAPFARIVTAAHPNEASLLAAIAERHAHR